LQYHHQIDGWKTEGRLAMITVRSFREPDDVNGGRFGIDITFSGLSSKACGLPVEFTHSHETAFPPVRF
jgi:hypothetical protein